VAIKAPSRAANKHVPKHIRSKKSQPKKGFFRRFWWVFVLTPVLIVVMVLGALFVAYQRIELPDTLPPIQTSYLLDREGTTIAALHGSVDRTIVSLARISPNLQHAVIATEDAGFYNHPGVDVRGIIRAAWTDIVKRETVQGASTLTEQLVKNVYAGRYVSNADGTTDYVLPPRSIKEKIREALLSVKLEQSFTKDQILSKYLNTVYFGHGAYGAEAAAETYFGVHASELTVLQSASLAGVLHAPSLYDPILSPYDNKFRRDYSLDQMVRYGYLDAAKAAKLKQRACCGTIEDTIDKIQAPYGSAYFIDYARQYLFDRYGSARVYSGGLHVTTSLDMHLQKAAWDSVRQNLPFTGYNPSAALVSMDPNTGEILAMVGGRDFNRSKLNLATFKGGTGREAGSAFKAFTLAAALENDYSLNKYWVGPSQITINDPTCDSSSGPWQPINAGDGEAGTFSLLQATEHSVNTVYAQLVSQLGPDKVVEMAHRLGIRSPLPAVCAITLGSVAINPLEMTNGYATLAARGVLHRATPLVEVANQHGVPVDNVASGGRQVLDQNLADEVTYALRYVVLGGTGTSARLSPWEVAGKTGTANENVDAWFCGYTVQLVTCVWVGYPQGEIPLKNVEGVPSVYGGTIPAAIWHDYMAVAMEGYPAESFTTPTFTGTLGPAAPVSLPTPSPTPTPTPSVTPSPSPTESPSPSPSESPSPSDSSSPSTSPSAAPRSAPPRGRDP
jgi:penicillin-binding protein 1A